MIIMHKCATIKRIRGLGTCNGISLDSSAFLEVKFAGSFCKEKNKFLCLS